MNFVRASRVWWRARRPSREWIWLALGVLALLSVRLPFLPIRLEDIDSINFDLGVHDYNPVAHQPHPPGYPVYILFATIVHAVVGAHATALGLVSAIFGSLCLIPLYLLLREITSPRIAAGASVVTLTSPLVWFNGVRPMSDETGLFVTLVAQCLLVMGSRRMSAGFARGRGLWLAGVCAAGLATGVRLQTVFLVAPLLLVGWIRHREIRVPTCAWFAASVGAWLVPVLYFSGGVAPYYRSFALLLADALPVEPLVGNITIRRVAWAVLDTFVTPWSTPWLAVPVLVLAAVGTVTLLRSNWRALAWLLLLFLPYTTYHLLLQNTPTIRYAVPIVPMVAVLATVAVCSGSWSQRRRVAAVAAGLAFTTGAAVSTVPALAAYHATPGPAAQALDYLRGMSSHDAMLLSGHYVFTRYLSRLDETFDIRFPVVGNDLRPVFDYWKSGGRKPVLFLKNPARMSLLLLSSDTQTLVQRWNWPDSVLPFLKGERPLRAELWRIEPPRWFSDGGLLTSPEAGAPDRVARQPHRFFLRPSDRRRVLIASGRLPERDSADVALQVGGRVLNRFRVRRDFTLTATVEPNSQAGAYVPVAFETSAPALLTDLWVAPEGQPSIRPANGFYTPERDAGLALFRWIAPRAEAAVYLPVERGHLRIRGQIPVKYYELPVTLSLEWGGRPLGSVSISTPSFEFDRTLPRLDTGEAWGTLVLKSSHSFVPEERQHNGDVRQLAIRIDELTLTPEIRGR
jgi:hypothetical protein